MCGKGVGGQNERRGSETSTQVEGERMIRFHAFCSALVHRWDTSPGKGRSDHDGVKRSEELWRSYGFVTDGRE